MTEVYTYPCSVCKVEMKWIRPEPNMGNTCPNCRSRTMDEMIAWGEEQRKEEEQLFERMNDWWDNLPNDAKEKAFFCVVKRIVDAELIEKKSYKQILYEEFGFPQEAYYMGIICGFMRLHNSIIPPDELGEMRQALREKKERAKQFRDAFTLKSVCDTCGYQSMDIRPKDNRMCPIIDCEGAMVEINK